MLIPEYKRDLNRNYMILSLKPGADTDAYQTRMLLTHAIPGLLHCSLQNLDSDVRLYYDITSRCSLHELYEDRHLKYEDLRLIFGGFIQVMEGMTEYLMNPSDLVLDPAFIYADGSRQSLAFCCLPGYEMDIRCQFQQLTETILPKLDHRDTAGVMLGYGIYRKALEETFHLEHIKEELYRPKGNPEVSSYSSGKPELFEENRENEQPHSRMKVSDYAREKGEVQDSLSNPGFADSFQAKAAEKKGPCVQAEGSGMETAPWNTGEKAKSVRPAADHRRQLLLRILAAAAAASILLVIVLLKQMGILPFISVEVLLGSVTGLMALLCLILYLRKKRKTGSAARLDVQDLTEGENTAGSSVFSNTGPTSTSERSGQMRGLAGRTIPAKGSESKRRPSVSYEQADPFSFPSEENKGSTVVPDGNRKLEPDTIRNHMNGCDTESAAGPDHLRKKYAFTEESCQETMVLTAANLNAPAALISREPGELPVIYLQEDLTVIGKLENAADAVIDVPTVSRVHAKIRKQDGKYYLTDLNSRNGTTVNGHLLASQEAWCLEDQDEVDFASARYVFIH